MSAPTPRLANYMYDRLGPELWGEFVAYANKHHKAVYVDAFVWPVLHCVGRTDGTPCPHTFRVELNHPDTAETLEILHLDHEHPVRLTCREWHECRPSRRRGMTEWTATPCATHSSVSGSTLCMERAACAFAAAHKRTDASHSVATATGHDVAIVCTG